MNPQIPTPKISLYHLFGDANANAAYQTLAARCSISTSISTKNIGGMSKETDIGYLSTHYSDQLAALFTRHETVQMYGYTIATMPYNDAAAVTWKLPHHHASFAPSIMNETIKNLLTSHYKVMLPIDAPDLFRPVIENINKHYLQGAEKLDIGNFKGQAYVTIPARNFDLLVNEWQRDKIRPFDKSLISRLSDPRYFAEAPHASPKLPPLVAPKPKAPEADLFAFDESRRTTPKTDIHAGDPLGKIVVLQAFQKRKG